MLELIGLLLVIIVLYYIYRLSRYNYNYKEGYLVRNEDDKKDAVDKLAQVNNNLRKIVFYVSNKIKSAESKSIKTSDDLYVLEYKEYIDRIRDALDYVIIKETSPDSEHTSYSINKGEELVFCIRSKKTNKIHDMNLIMYVAIHELAHIGCPEVGHTALFNKINIFLLKQGMEIGIYRYENYDSSPVEYCGMNLNSNVLN